MGAAGWYLDSLMAVAPDSVKMAMPRRSRSSAAWAVASQMVSATERVLWRGRGGCDSLGLGVGDVLLGFGDDAGHHFDGFDGVSAHGGFAGQHHRIRPVVNGVGYVGDFGAGGGGLSIIDSSIWVAVMTGLR